MPKPNLDYTPLWEAALVEELGLVIMVNDPPALRAKLYEARKIAANPRFDTLVMFLPAIGDRIFLVRKSAELDP